MLLIILIKFWSKFLSTQKKIHTHIHMYIYVHINFLLEQLGGEITSTSMMFQYL